MNKEMKLVSDSMNYSFHRSLSMLAVFRWDSVTFLFIVNCKHLRQLFVCSKLKTEKDYVHFLVHALPIFLFLIFVLVYLTIDFGSHPIEILVKKNCKTHSDPNTTYSAPTRQSGRLFLIH